MLSLTKNYHELSFFTVVYLSKPSTHAEEVKTVSKITFHGLGTSPFVFQKLRHTFKTKAKGNGLWFVLSGSSLYRGSLDRESTVPEFKNINIKT